MFSTKTHQAAFRVIVLLSFFLIHPLAKAQTMTTLQANESKKQNRRDNLSSYDRFALGFNLALTSEINSRPGILGTVALLFNASNRLSFALSAGFFSRQHGATTTNFTQGDNGQLIVVDSITENYITQNAIPLFLSGRFYITNTKVKPYVSVEWNYYYLINKDASPIGRHYLIEQNGEKRLLAIGLSNREDGTALGIGFGVNTPLGKNRNLDLSLQFIDSNYTYDYVRVLAGYYISL